MLKSIITKIQTFKSSEDGATLVEYGIALTLAVTIGASAMFGLRDSVGGTLDAAGDNMPTAADKYTAPTG